MVETVPEGFEALIPEKPHSEFKYEKEGAGSMPGTMVAHQLISSIKSKCTPEEAMVLLKDLPNPLSDEESKSTESAFSIETVSYHQKYHKIFAGIQILIWMIVYNLCTFCWHEISLCTGICVVYAL